MSRALLLILDGFGIGKDNPFNAIANAKMPFYRDLLKKYPYSQLMTHGRHVGLPDGVMGNSEVGHMTMGAGRIIYQDLTRITKEIEEKTFFKNPVLIRTLLAGAQATGRVHLMGLLSDGGVHSHIDHLFALLDLCAELKIPNVFLHLFTDGRDTPPDSSSLYMERLLSHTTLLNKSNPTQTQIATIGGRYFGMDRDQRWDRVEKAYKTITGQSEHVELTPLQVIQASHQAGKTDEFIEPVLLNPVGGIKKGDSLVFFNYRSDRAREISASLALRDFRHFVRPNHPVLSAFCGMTNYDAKMDLDHAYGPQNLENIFGLWLEKKRLRQFRTAETEKYAHVTFFFNGGREDPFLFEERTLIPSPKDIATYDLRPEMSAFEVANEAEQRILLDRYDFMLMNFANADMVGHTGNYAATVQAMEALDKCLAQVVGAAQKNNYHVLITADHGNAEEMQDSCGRIHTQHTLNPVPAIWVEPNSAIAPKKLRTPLKDGGLQDLMPTLCQIMGLDLPPEVTGKSLLPESKK